MHDHRKNASGNLEANQHSRARADANIVWQAAISSVEPAELVRRLVSIDNSQLKIAQRAWDLANINRLVIVGAGKATAGMAQGLLAEFHDHALPPITGWVNVVDGQSFDGPIQIFEARPAGTNLPTERVVHGTQQILQLVDGLGSDDLLIALLSGGGSALLELPAEGLSLKLLRETTQTLSQAGANIEQLNNIRRELSQVKAGRLAARIRRTGADALCLVLSDIIGDPLDLVASGPFWMGNEHAENLPHFIVGNNQTAVNAAGDKARSIGYRTKIIPADFLRPETTAEQHAAIMAEKLIEHRLTGEPMAFVWGGEPVVRVSNSEGIGGRNQHLVLCAVLALMNYSETEATVDQVDWCLLSGATDAEDGNTSSAGAVVDAQSFRDIKRGTSIDQVQSFRDRFHSGTFCQEYGLGLTVECAPSNVADIRILLIHPSA